MNMENDTPQTPEQEIAEMRANPQPTLRAVAPGMEKHLYTINPVLDHGFVRVIDYMGDDAAITQAARVSYGKRHQGRVQRRRPDPLSHAPLALDPV